MSKFKHYYCEARREYAVEVCFLEMAILVGLFVGVISLVPFPKALGIPAVFGLLFGALILSLACLVRTFKGKHGYSKFSSLAFFVSSGALCAEFCKVMVINYL